MILLKSLSFLALTALTSAQPAPTPPPLVRVPAPALPPVIVPLPSADTPGGKARRARFDACRIAANGQDYLPQPPLFRITDSDTTLYLLGSVHRLPSGFAWRSPQLDEVVAKSDKLITENGTEILPGGPNPFPFDRAGEQTEARQHPPLDQRLSGERRAKWQGMNVVGPRFMMDWIDRQPDWRAAMAILSFVTRVGPERLGAGVEDQLRLDFRVKRKPIEGLEQSKDVLAGFHALSPAIQRAMLEQSFDLIGQPSREGEYRAMFHRWARGESVVEPLENALPAELKEFLLDRRNAAWVPEIRKHLGPRGTRLVVVGAGHLTGRNNLLELLTAAGMTPERVSRTGPPIPRPAFTPQPKSLEDCDAYRPLPAPPSPPPPLPRVKPRQD